MAENTSAGEPSELLLKLIREYLAMVKAGRLDAERTFAHDKMMKQMNAEGFEYADREDARRLAEELLKKHEEE